MEIKVIKVGIERNKPLYKVIGSNFGKRAFEEDIFRAINPIQAIARATECDYGSLKTGDYFRAPKLDNLDDYWMIKSCYLQSSERICSCNPKLPSRVYRLTG